MLRVWCWSYQVQDGVVGRRDVGFNLCVTPFPNVYVPDFKLEDSHWRFSVFGGWRVGGSEVLSSRWFDIWTSKCYREFELFNSKLALMYDGRAEARMKEQEYWNGLIYWKQKGENWDEDMKMSSEFKRTKTEWWRQMKTGMWSGFSKVIWSSWRAKVMRQRARGVLGVWGFG